MDVILDEARKRGMQVWILDDSHFPTGFANGAVKTAPDALCRQSILGNEKPLDAAAGPLTLGPARRGSHGPAQARPARPDAGFRGQGAARPQL